MIDNVFELNDPAMRPGVNDVTVNGVSVLTSGNVAEVPAIDNVTQTNTTADAEHRVLLSNSANSTTETAGVGKSNGLLYNPSAKQLIVRNPNFSTYMTMAEPNIGIFQKSNPNGYWGGMRITARDIRLEGKVSDTSSVNQTWDGANTSLKSAISSLRTDMDSTTLSGTSEPTSSVGRENSLYVKYQGETEIVPSTSVPVRTWQSFPVDISSYQKIRIVIDGYDGYNRHHSYDDIIDVSSSPSYLHITDGDMILLQISLSENEYMSSHLTGQFTIYDDSFTIDDIYFKKDNTWIKNNVYTKDEVYSKDEIADLFKNNIIRRIIKAYRKNEGLYWITMNSDESSITSVTPFNRSSKTLQTTGSLYIGYLLTTDSEKDETKIFRIFNANKYFEKTNYNLSESIAVIIGIIGLFKFGSEGIYAVMSIKNNTNNSIQLGTEAEDKIFEFNDSYIYID